MPEGIRGQPLRYSKFHCRELLYDYMSGRLDQERHAAVEAGLKEFPELKTELGALISAAHYCAELGKIVPQEKHVEEFQLIRLKSEIVSEKIKYKNWPDLLRWSSEAIVISIFVAAVGWLIPWGSVRSVFNVEPSDEVILANLSGKNKTDVVVPPLEEKSDNESISTKTDLAETHPAITEPITNSLKSDSTEAKTNTSQSGSQGTDSAPASASAVVASSQVGTTAPVRSSPDAATVPKPVAKIPEKKKGPQGFLYRIMMNVAGIKESAPELRNQIVALGGKKAGQVEIGYRQTTGNYFHFSMPESNYQTLLKTLGAYGPVRIYKGPHERVMPPGIIRIILDIEDAKEKTGEKAKASGATTENATEANETPDSSAAPTESAPTTEDLSADETTSPGQ